MICASGVDWTVISSESCEVPQASVTVSVIVPVVLTWMEGVVSPVDQLLPVALEDVSVTVSPGQKVVGPPDVISAGVDDDSITMCSSESVPQAVLILTV